MANTKTKMVEVKSTMNDNVVTRFEMTENDSVNVITAGFSKICSMLKINRVQAESRYYVDVTNA